MDMLTLHTIKDIFNKHGFLVRVNHDPISDNWRFYISKKNVWAEGIFDSSASPDDFATHLMSIWSKQIEGVTISDEST